MRIGIIGDFNPKHHTHVAINAALEDTAAVLGEDLRSEWLPTPEITRPDSDKLLAEFDGLWATPASPYDSAEGMLRGIEYARSRNVPFTGT
jgi:CTP synthase (UTP-ammonia lyase)